MYLVPDKCFMILWGLMMNKMNAKLCLPCRPPRCHGTTCGSSGLTPPPPASLALLLVPVPVLVRLDPSLDELHGRKPGGVDREGLIITVITTHASINWP